MPLFGCFRLFAGTERSADETASFLLSLKNCCLIRFKCRSICVWNVVLRASSKKMVLYIWFSYYFMPVKNGGMEHFDGNSTNFS